MKRHILLALWVAIGALCVPASRARATIAGVTGEMEIVGAPPSVVFGDFVSTTHMRAFEERQNVTLASDLPVNISAPGTYDLPADLTPAVIPAGTTVNSYFLHADPHNLVSVRYNGSVTFDAPILGVLMLDSDLDDTDDILGAVGTTYPFGQISRGLELGLLGEDSLIMEIDGKTLTVDPASATIPGDQIRVITAVPEPTSMALLMLGAVTILRRRMR